MMDIAIPVPGFERKQRIDRRVQSRDVISIDGVLDLQKPVQIEQVFFHLSRQQLSLCVSLHLPLWPLKCCPG